MTIPIDAIDPEVTYQEWVKQYLWHVDQIPALLETVTILATPRLGVSRGGSRFDALQITGGGYQDNVPISDAGPSQDAILLWSHLHQYLEAIRTSGHPAAPMIALHIPTDPDSIRTASYTAIAWLADHVEPLSELHHLSDQENDFFALIRRMKGRYRNAGTPRRARPRTCTTCGDPAVVVDWVDAGNGSPKPVQVGLCKTCGETYTEAAA